MTPKKRTFRSPQTWRDRLRWYAFFLIPLIGIVPLLALSPSLRRNAASNDAPVRVRQGFFYKPPADGTTASEIARKADLVILTKGDERFRDAIRGSGYQGKVLQYVLASEAEGPFSATGAGAPCDPQYRPWQNQATAAPGDFCTFVHPNEDWFLHNGAGERLYDTQEGGQRAFYHMNPASPGWRQFLIERTLGYLEGGKAQAPLGYDGIFLDNVELGLYRAQYQLDNSDGTVQEFADQSAYQAAWVELLWRVSEAVHPRGWLLWANLISGSGGQGWQAYVDQLDGVMNESFATSWRTETYDPQGWDGSLAYAEGVLAKNKGFLAVSQGEDDALEPFALGSYLLVTDGRNAYFRYEVQGDYRQWRQYDNYAVALGRPKGARYQQADGTWRRDFEHGSVIVDPLARTGQIVPQGSGAAAP